MIETVSVDFFWPTSEGPRNRLVRCLSKRGDVEAGEEQTEPGDGRAAGGSEATYDEVTVIGATATPSTATSLFFVIAMPWYTSLFQWFSGYVCSQAHRTMATDR